MARKKLTNSQIITQFIDKYSTLYNYSLVNYVNATTEVDIICSIHGIFEQKPDKHKRGQGCPKCGGTSKSNTKSVIVEFNEIHHNLYNYSLVNYVNAKSKVDIICSIHGIFEQTPNSHKNGRGCSKCADEKKEKFHTIETYRNKKTTLYYIQILDNTFKIGLTIRGLTSRYTSDELKKIKVIKEWTFEDGAKAFVVEKQILNENKQSKYTGPKLLNSGHTEMFNTDIYSNILKGICQ